MSASPLVSVLIATRDRPALFRQCVESVVKQVYPRIELVVLDDASQPPLADNFLTPLDLGTISVQRLRADVSQGAVASRNRLIRVAKGDFLVVLDDDAVLESEHALSQIIEAFEAAPKIGVIAFRILDHVGQAQRLNTPIPRRLVRRKPQLAQHECWVSMYIGAAFAVRRSILSDSGLPPDMLTHLHDELDHTYRVLKAGYGVRYLPHLVAHHFPQLPIAKTAPVSVKQRVFYLIRNRLMIAFAHVPWPYFPVHCAVWMVYGGFTAMRTGAFAEYGRGLIAGLVALPRIQRKPASGLALQYLKQHFGRLWF